MDPFIHFEWPVEMLGRILHFLALGGASIAWQQLAYLTHKNVELTIIADKVSRPLVVRVGFDGSVADKKFIMPFQKATVAQIEIDWGDDSPLHVITDVGVGYVEHEYKDAAANEYTVRVFPLKVDGSSLDHLGRDLEKISWVEHHWWRPLRSLDTLGSLGVRSLSALFHRAFEFNLPISHLDVSGVTDMKAMFCLAKEFNQPIGKWNVSNVTDMSFMFDRCAMFNQPIGGWNVSRLQNMAAMFSSASSFNQPIGDWDTSSVVEMTATFFRCRDFNQDISHWNVSKVTNMTSMFYSAASFDQPIGGWDVGQVKNFGTMFAGALEFNQDIGDWDIGNLNNLDGMFTAAANFDRRHVSRWNLSTNQLSHMF